MMMNDTVFSNRGRTDFRLYRVHFERKAMKIDPNKRLAVALREIWPQVFHAEFTRKQLQFVNAVEHAIRSGANCGRVDVERGQGTTSILSCAVMWAALVGWRRFSLFVNSRYDAGWFVNLLKSANVGTKLDVRKRKCGAVVVVEVLGHGAIGCARKLSQTVGLRHAAGSNVERPSLIVVDGYDGDFIKHGTAGPMPPSSFMATCPEAEHTRAGGHVPKHYYEQHKQRLADRRGVNPTRYAVAGIDVRGDGVSVSHEVDLGPFMLAYSGHETTLVLPRCGASVELAPWQVELLGQILQQRHHELSGSPSSSLGDSPSGRSGRRRGEAKRRGERS